MEDDQIIALYWNRDEEAIAETAKKYGRYCHAISFRILQNNEDSEECVNDVYLAAWNGIPPGRPSVLSAFLAKITRNLALNRYEQSSAKKRGGGEVPLAIEELEECLPGGDNVEKAVEDAALTELFNQFLASLHVESRRIFMRRYWYFDTVREIAARYGIGESRVKMSLLRSRRKLKQFLEKEW